jgi:hypothetical protein
VALFRILCGLHVLQAHTVVGLIKSCNEEYRLRVAVDAPASNVHARITATTFRLDLTAMSLPAIRSSFWRIASAGGLTRLGNDPEVSRDFQDDEIHSSRVARLSQINMNHRAP